MISPDRDFVVYYRSCAKGKLITEFFEASTEEDAIAACREKNPVVVDASAALVDHVLMSRLSPFIDMEDPWGAKFSMSLLDSVDGVEDKQYEWEEDAYGKDIWSAERHARRINSLRANPEKLRYPIQVDNECSGMAIYPIPIIIDGWHRYFAHLKDQLPIIRVFYGGRTDLLDYLTGRTDECPPF